MKNTIVSLTLAVALLTAGAFAASAQTATNQPPASPGSFFNTAESYFTTFNTNLDVTFGSTNYRGSVIIGADYVQSVNISSSLSLSYDLPFAWKGVSAESTTRNAGIAGVILSQQCGVGYNIVVHDTKLTAFMEGGYDFNASKPYVAIGARISKALTEHTFAGIGLEGHFNGHVSTPILSIFTGFTF